MNKKIIATILILVLSSFAFFGCTKAPTKNEQLITAYFNYLSTDPTGISTNNYYTNPLTMLIDGKTVEYDAAAQQQIVDYYKNLGIKIVKLTVSEESEDIVSVTVYTKDNLTDILNLGTYSASMEFYIDGGKITKIIQVTDSGYLSSYKINFAGSIGIDYTIQEDGNLLVTKILSASPAKTAGLKVNDVITKIDGKECSKMNKTLDEYYYRLRGLASSTVNLEIKRGAETTTLDVTRQRLTRSN